MVKSMPRDEKSSSPHVAILIHKTLLQEVKQISTKSEMMGNSRTKAQTRIALMINLKVDIFT